MSTQYDRDCQYGMSKEDEFQHVLEAHFDDNLKRNSNRYSRWDFTGDKYVYELKSRKNAHDRFPTTMIGADKIKDNACFVFAFTDGLYYIYYDKVLFSNFTTEPFGRVRSGIEDVKKDYLFIPIKHLTKIKGF